MNEMKRGWEVSVSLNNMFFSSNDLEEDIEK